MDSDNKETPSPRLPVLAYSGLQPQPYRNPKMKRSSHITTLLQITALALLPGAVSGDQLQPGDTFRDCENCPLMVVVPPGSFMMGSPDSEGERYDREGPVHEVTLAKPFAVGVYEVSFTEWDVCVSAGGCSGYRPDDWDWGRGSRPVINVGWDDAQGYVDWLSGATGKTYRLLSESEWEYAARAGTTGRYHWGNRISSSKANYGQKVDKTMPVGSYPPNAFGLHDVHGNVSEWVGDCWSDSYSGAPTDGSVWEAGDCGYAVKRGGSWRGNPRNLRSANRVRITTGYRLISVGFRVARTLAP